MTGRHYIRAGWLIDGSGEQLQKDMLLIVTDGVISGIEPFRQDNSPDSREITDLSFGSILPPFVDSHLHLAMSGTMDKQTREHQLVAGCDELEPVIAQHLEQLFAHGVLAVRDGGDRENCVSGYLQKYRGGTYPVRVQTPGRAWHKQKRYGGLIGRYPGENETLAQAYVRQKEHHDYVKLVNSGLNSLKEYGRQTKPQFSLEEVRDLVRRAAEQGRKVMVHANGQQPVQDALEAGCHSIEHGFFMGRENLKRMADSDCVWVPTVCTMKAYAEILEYQREYASADVARRNMQHQLEQLRMARELGVKVALGTDAGSPGVLHGESLFEEMKLFVKAGYDLSEAVQSATSIGADLLGVHEIGRLQKGMPADFIVARGTPAQLPRKFSYLEGIYLGGHPCEQYRKNPHKEVVKPG
jgi:imidazolonepropionase-like amidohydrolase